jgi:AcrR family transcriptional regulator
MHERRLVMRTEPAKRGRPRDPDAEPRIRACAVELLLERGFDRMTVDDVAEAAGVGKATIYRRWPSKEQLAYDALTHLFDLEIPEPDTGSYEEDIRQLYLHSIQLASTDVGRAMIRLGVSEATRDPVAAGIYKRFLQRRIDDAAERLERARERGEPLRDGLDPALLVEWLTGLFVVRVVTGAPMPTESDVDEMVELTLHGVLKRS